MDNMVNKVICIIPARENSKRIKNKNIIDFDGKPMIYWTIKAALDSNIFDRIVISTDSKKIANIASLIGIKVPFLREGLSDDFTPISEVTIAALKQAEQYWSENYEIVVQLMANCPNRNETNIQDAFNYFNEKNLESLVSCSKMNMLLPWWSFTIDNNRKPKYNFPNFLNIRSQDLEEAYCPSGALWISKSSKLIEHKSFYGPNHHAYPLDWFSAIDIDTYDDLKIAQLARVFKKEK